MIFISDFFDKSWIINEANCSHIKNSDQVLLMEDIGYSIVLPIVCGVGIILNILNIIVLFRRPLSDSLIHAYLGIVALTDLVTLTLVAPIGFARCSKCDDLSVSAVVYEAYIYMPLSNTSASTSIWLTTAVTTERCIMVRSSVPSKKDSVKRAWILFGCFASAAFLLNMPYFFCYRIKDGNSIYTNFGAGYGFQVYSWIRSTLIGYLPTILVIVFNALLLQSVWQANRRRSIMLKNSLDYQKIKCQIRLSVLLIAASLIFVVCHIPESFVHPGIVRYLRGPCGNEMDSTKIHRVIANILEMLSYSYQFILYVTCNDQFRKGFFQLSQTLLCRRTRVDVAKPDNQTPSLS